MAVVVEARRDFGLVCAPRALLAFARTRGRPWAVRTLSLLESELLCSCMVVSGIVVQPAAFPCRAGIMIFGPPSFGGIDVETRASVRSWSHSAGASSKSGTTSSKTLVRRCGLSRLPSQDGGHTCLELKRTVGLGTARDC